VLSVLFCSQRILYVCLCIRLNRLQSLIHTVSSIPTCRSSRNTT